jgi:hypothetical protein
MPISIPPILIPLEAELATAAAVAELGIDIVEEEGDIDISLIDIAIDMLWVDDISTGIAICPLGNTVI